MSDDFTRVISVYANTEQALDAYTKLIARQKELYDEIDKASAAGKPIGELANKLKGVTEQVDRAAQKVSGNLSPSLRDLQSALNKTNLELNRMSKEDAGFDKKTQDAKKLRTAIDEQVAALGRTKAAMTEMKSLAAGFGIGFGLEKVGEAFKASIDEAMKGQDINARLKNSLEGVGRTDLFEGMNEQAEHFAKQFKFLIPDAIKEAQEKLITFGKLSKNQMDQLLPVIIDYSAKERKSLSESTDDILRGLEGQGRGLKLLGIELQKGGNAATNFGIIMDQLKPRVAGAAAAFENNARGFAAVWDAKFTEMKKAAGEFMLSLIGLGEKKVDPIKSLQASMADFNAEMNAVKDANMPLGQRKQLIDDINTKYGEYLPNLLTEKTSLDQINEAQQKVNASMGARILAIAYEKQYKEIVDDQIESLQTAYRLRNQIAKTQTVGGSGAGGLSAAELEMQNRMLENQAEINQNAASRSKERIDQLNEQFKAMAGTMHTTFEEMQKYLSGNASKNSESFRTDTKLDSDLEAWKDFLRKVADLKNEVEAKKNGTDADELAKLTNKYNDLLAEAQKFADKRKDLTSRVVASQKEIYSLYYEALAKMEDEQATKHYEKDLAARLVATKEFFEIEKSDALNQYANLELGKEQYENKVMALDLVSKKAQLKIYIDNESFFKEDNKNNVEALAKFNEQKVAAEKAVQDQFTALTKKANEERNAHINSQDKADVTTAHTKNDINGERDAKLKQNQDELTQRLEQVKGEKELEEEAVAESNARKLQIESEYYAAIANEEQKYGNAVISISKNLDQIANNSENYQLAMDKYANNLKLQNLQDQLSQGLITQQQFNQQETAMKKQMDLEEEEIAKRQFNRKKALGLVSAIISMAVGITKDLEAGMPAAIPLMVATGIAGGAEIAAIASTKYAPSHGEGTILGGDSHSDRSGGNPTIDPKTGRILHYTEKGEAVIDKHTTGANMPIIRQLLSAKGRELPQLNVRRAIENIRLADGGIVGEPGSRHGANEYDSGKMDELIGHVKNMNDSFQKHQSQPVKFVQNDYDRFNNHRQVVYQNNL